MSTGPGARAAIRSAASGAVTSIPVARETATTRAPSCSSSAAVAAPMPRLAPVTTATRPAIPRSMAAMLRVAPRGPLRRRAVRATEQHGVDEQRQELPQLDALLVPGRERADLLVGGEEGRTGRAEQAQHREVDLAVAAVGRGVDQPWLPGGVPQLVAAP